MRNTLLTGFMAVLMTGFLSDSALAGKCQSIIKPTLKHAAEACELAENQEFKPEESSDWYFNPTILGCDMGSLGFSLPGLPDFTMGIPKIDLCGIISHVTEDVILDINEQTQSSIDSAINDATGGYGTDVNINTGVDGVSVGGQNVLGSGKTQRLLDTMNGISEKSGTN